MALRSLGQTLISKASPGAALRKVAEQNIEAPAIPGKAEPGGLDRTSIEEPLERSVSEGSDKIVAAKPTVEAAALDNVTAPPVAPGIGLPPNVTPSSLPGSNNQALFRGGLGNPGVVAADEYVPQTSPDEVSAQAPSAPGSGQIAPGRGGSVAPSPTPGGSLRSATNTSPLRSAVLGTQTQSQSRPTPKPTPAPQRPAVNSLGGRTIAQLPNISNILNNVLKNLFNFIGGGNKGGPGNVA